MLKRYLFLFTFTLISIVCLNAQVVFGPEALIYDGSEEMFPYLTRISDVADFDGDGDVDLVYGFVEANQIIWAKNNGIGDFSFQQSVTNSADEVNQVKVGDIDNDGDMDIIAVHYLTNKIMWYENDGQGHFFAEHLISDSLVAPKTLKVADMDGDGFLDVLILTDSNGSKFGISYNLGSGNFGPMNVIGEIPYFLEFFITGFSGNRDIIFRSDGTELSWIHNLGQQQFDTISVFKDFSTYCDYILDYYVYSGEIYLLVESNGIESIYTSVTIQGSSVTHQITFNDGYHRGNLNRNDFNGYLYVTEYSTFMTEVYNSNGFQLIESIDREMERDRIIFEDFNLDGLLDFEYYGGVHLKLSWNNSSYAFQPLDFGFGEINKIDLYDMQGDGERDLVVLSDGELHWFKLENGNYGYPKTLSSHFSFGHRVSSTAIGDWNNDGYDNYLIARSQGEIACIESDSNENANFNNVQTLYPTSHSFKGFAIENINSDSINDVIVHDLNTLSHLYWLPGVGNGNYGQKTLINSVLPSYSFNYFSVSDVETDGDEDIVLDMGSSSVRIFSNNGLGDFTYQNLQPYGTYVKYYSDDYDFNGTTETYWISTDGNIYIEYSDSMGVYLNATINANANEATNAKLFDIDMDGDLDLLYTDTLNDAVMQSTNCGGSFCPPIPAISNVEDPENFLMNDVNNDGRDDVIVYSSWQDKIVWFANESSHFFAVNPVEDPTCNFDNFIQVKNCSDTLGFSYDLFFDGSFYGAYNSLIDLDTVFNVPIGEYEIFLQNYQGVLDTLSFEMGGPNTNVQHELSIQIGATEFMPSLCAEIEVNFSNNDCTPISGSAWVALHPWIVPDTSLTSYDSISGDTLYWQFDSLILDSGIISKTILVRIDSNALNSNQLCINAGIGPIYFDSDSTNNLLDTCIEVKRNLDLHVYNYECNSSSTIRFDFFSKDPPFYYTHTDINGLVNIDTTNSLVKIISSLQTGLHHFKIEDNCGSKLNRSIFVNSPYGNNVVDFRTNITSGIFVPGFPGSLSFHYNNDDCLAADGDLVIEVDPQFLANVSLYTISNGGNTSGYALNGNTYTWGLNNIVNTESHDTYVQYNFVTNPTATLGTNLCFTSTFYPTATDIDSSNNQRTICETIVGPYDPNDKTVYPSGLCNDNFVLSNTPLEYRIRFQNTGSYEALNVTILDTIDKDMEVNSIQLLSYSYENTFAELISDSVIAFRMYNIMLPDSGSDLEGSQGYVYYSISPKPGLAPFTRIENSASIFFDFNDPIITNTVHSTYVPDLDVLKDSTFEISFSCLTVDTGFQTFLFQNTNGCDSLHSIQTNLSPSDSSFIHSSACNPLDTGLFYTSFLNQYGCDSIHTDSIYFVPPVNGDTLLLIECDSFEWKGILYYQSEFLLDTVNLGLFCDSIYAIDLTINSSQIVDGGTFFGCDSVTFNDSIYTENATVQMLFNSSLSCDSLVNYEVVVYPEIYLDTFISIWDTTTFVLPNGDTATSNGEYIDTLLSFQQCDSIYSINLDIMIYVGLNAVANSSLKWNVYPNPTSRNIFVELFDAGEKYRIDMYNCFGQKVFSEQSSVSFTSINVSSWPHGIYNVSVYNAEGEVLGIKNVVVTD